MSETIDIPATVVPGRGEARSFDDEGSHSIDPVTDSARTSRPNHQFWIWAGANTAPINWLLGALGIQQGLGLGTTVAVLVVGNLIGMSVFGVFVLMGQQTGVTQMVLSRAAFGRRGAHLPTLLQGVISAGWCAINTYIVLSLVMALLGKLGVHPASAGQAHAIQSGVVLLVMGVQVWIAANGFRWIAAFEKYTVPVTLVVLVLMTVVAWTRLHIDWGYAGDAQLTGGAKWSVISGVMTAIGIGWGITWFAYASDYSRFVPRTASRRRLYLASTLGQFLPVIWLGLLGATLATRDPSTDPGELIVGSFGVLALPVLLLVLHGPIATNIVNLYSCGLAAQALGLSISRRTLAYVVGAAASVFTIFLVFHNDLGSTIDAWLAGLVTWVAPWAGIMLVHWFVIARRRISVPDLYRTPEQSCYGDVRWPALVAFIVGMATTWMFEFGLVSWLQGPIARAMGGVDLSWLAGLIVGAGLYLVLYRVDARRATAAPA